MILSPALITVRNTSRSREKFYCASVSKDIVDWDLSNSKTKETPLILTNENSGKSPI